MAATIRCYLLVLVTHLFVQCNAWHLTDIKSLECMSVCLTQYHSSTIDRGFCPVFLKFGM